MFQTAMTGAGFMPMGDDAIDEYGMDGAFRRIVFQVFREAPGAAAACRPLLARLCAGRTTALPLPSRVLSARVGAAEFDGYPMHGTGGPGEKAKPIPLDFFNGTRASGTGASRAGCAPRAATRQRAVPDAPRSCSVVHSV
jgi:hypothetical protein